MVFVITLIIVVCVLLVLVILAQNSKGGGLSSQFGGSSASNMIGVKKTSDLLEKITWGLAIALLALTLSTKFLIPKEESLVNPARNNNPTPASTLPAPIDGGGDNSGVDAGGTDGGGTGGDPTPVE
ncbi:MAG: preprotein translocase subunit SecG [Bacteroidota bacterium]